MDDCVFCNIVNKTLGAELLFENDKLIAIRDILPKAPVHVLIIPKKHVLSINHLEADDVSLAGEMLVAAKQIAEKFGVAETGYKLMFNVGRDGGQVIPHLHLHLLGGKNLGD